EATSRGQHGNEAVQLAVELHFVEDLRAVTLHAAVVVVQLHAGQPAHHEVEDSTREDLVPGVVAFSLPAADHVEPAGVLVAGQLLAVCQGRKKAGNLGRIVLQVRVQRQYNIPPGG